MTLFHFVGILGFRFSERNLFSSAPGPFALFSVVNTCEVPVLSSTTLELAIGMAFIYLLLSLFCTAINEIIAGVLASRARNLERGLRSLFTEGTLPKRTEDGTIVRDAQGRPAAGIAFADAVYRHGLLQSLYPSGTGNGIKLWWGGGRRLPSYIPTRTFVSVVVDLLFHDAVTPFAGGDTPRHVNLSHMLAALEELPDSKAKQALQTLVRQAGGDLAATRRALEGWFNDGMDRVSGWYKRKTQIVLFCLGLGLALLFNIDSIHIARVLWTNPALRAYTVAAASRYAEHHPLSGDTPTAAGAAASSEARAAVADPAQEASTVFTSLQSLALPIGWNGDGPLQWAANRRMPHILSGEALLFALAGWLLTAVAMTLGAPFWFDTLNKFMVVRSTVKPREKSEVELSKDA